MTKNSLKLLTFMSCVTLFTSFLAVTVAPRSAKAESLKEARLTQIIKDVKLLPGGAAPRIAVVNDEIRGGTAVRTGVDSRTELTFTDLTLTRLGANSIFSFNQATRNLDLGEGAMLFQVPKGSGGATIKTASVTAAITGTTGVNINQGTTYVFLILEGHALVSRTGHPEDSVEVLAGQMLTGKAGEPLGHPVQFSILKFMNSYVLIVGFPTPLPQGVLDLIAFEASKQPNDGSLVDAIAIILGLSKDPAGLTVGNINSINRIGSINPANISKPQNVNSSEQPPPAH
jgi:mannose-6-phosphate isomerase-like protein (cupin superfamily)